MTDGVGDLRKRETVKSGSVSERERERASTVCVHAGPQYPCKQKIEHRDTLYFSFNSENVVMLHFHILFLLC